MTRRTEQLDRIEALLGSLAASSARLEEAVAGHAGVLREQVAAVRLEVQAVKATAESAHAGVQALADMLPVPHPETAPQAIPPAAPDSPSAVPPAAGGEAAGEPATAARRAPKTLKPKAM